MKVEWKDISINPPKKEEESYLVGVVTEDGSKAVTVALCDYDDGKYYWEIMDLRIDILQATITKWAELPSYPEEK